MLIVTAALVGCLVGSAYYLVVTRPENRASIVSHFIVLESEVDCCTAGARGGARCLEALEDLAELSVDGNTPWDWPVWFPTGVRYTLDTLRGADDAARQAEALFRRCPAAQELVALSNESLIERLCGLVATAEERDSLARKAARKGILVASISRTACSAPGFDAGLRQIQVDFDHLCDDDACLEALMAAPDTSRARVQEIVAAHPDEVLSAVATRLGPDQDPRLTQLMAYAVPGDARLLAALSRGDLSGLDLESALDLLDLPMHPRKIAILRLIRDISEGLEADVAAVYLDAAVAATASERELTRGLLEMQRHQCALLERALAKLDLTDPQRTDAAIPAMRRCPRAAQQALSDDQRIALTEGILEAALGGLFGDVDDILIDRLFRAPASAIETFLTLGERPDLDDAAERVLPHVKHLVTERLAQLEGEPKPSRAQDLNRGRGLDADLDSNLLDPTLDTQFDRGRARPRALKDPNPTPREPVYEIPATPTPTQDQRDYKAFTVPQPL